MPAAGADRKFAVFGALDYATGQVCSQLSPRKDSQAFVGFLEQLRQTWPQAKPIAVLDNVGYHKSHRTSAWWRRWQRRLCPFFLPAHTPEPNLMERVWRHVKDQLSCHRWWADWRALWEATATLLAHLTARFHRRKGPGIAVVQNFGAST